MSHLLCNVQRFLLHTLRVLGVAKCPKCMQKTDLLNFFVLDRVYVPPGEIYHLFVLMTTIINTESKGTSYTLESS